jgi:hypothetical protein
MSKHLTLTDMCDATPPCVGQCSHSRYVAAMKRRSSRIVANRRASPGIAWHRSASLGMAQHRPASPGFGARSSHRRHEPDSPRYEHTPIRTVHRLRAGVQNFVAPDVITADVIGYASAFLAREVELRTLVAGSTHFGVMEDVSRETADALVAPTAARASSTGLMRQRWKPMLVRTGHSPAYVREQRASSARGLLRRASGGW